MLCSTVIPRFDFKFCCHPVFLFVMQQVYKALWWCNLFCNPTIGSITGAQKSCFKRRCHHQGRSQRIRLGQGHLQVKKISIFYYNMPIFVQFPQKGLHFGTSFPPLPLGKGSNFLTSSPPETKAVYDPDHRCHGLGN